MRKLFELDAAVSDAERGITALWKGLEVTTIDGTTMELARSDVLGDEFGTPADGARPLLRAVVHVRTASRRWTGAEIGGYHEGRTTWPTGWNGRWGRDAEPRRPGLFLHGPVPAVLRDRGAPGLAGQKRGEMRPGQDRPRQARVPGQARDSYSKAP